MTETSLYVKCPVRSCLQHASNSGKNPGNGHIYLKFFRCSKLKWPGNKLLFLSGNRSLKVYLYCFLSAPMGQGALEYATKKHFPPYLLSVCVHQSWKWGEGAALGNHAAAVESSVSSKTEKSIGICYSKPYFLLSNLHRIVQTVMHIVVRKCLFVWLLLCLIEVRVEVECCSCDGPRNTWEARFFGDTFYSTKYIVGRDVRQGLGLGRFVHKCLSNIFPNCLVEKVLPKKPLLLSLRLCIMT